MFEIIVIAKSEAPEFTRGGKPPRPEVVATRTALSGLTNYQALRIHPDGLSYGTLVGIVRREAKKLGLRVRIWRAPDSTDSYVALRS